MELSPSLGVFIVTAFAHPASFLDDSCTVSEYKYDICSLSGPAITGRTMCANTRHVTVLVSKIYDISFKPSSDCNCGYVSVYAFIKSSVTVFSSDSNFAKTFSLVKSSSMLAPTKFGTHLARSGGSSVDVLYIFSEFNLNSNGKLTPRTNSLNELRAVSMDLGSCMETHN
uniref:ORF58 n=1 Tax=Malaco herpesvirus 4 TaxID=3031800 RepID=A0AA48P823_9VIRU|nr:TPA_asm: ORF58 [Malaco herpesvirus 4]